MANEELLQQKTKNLIDTMNFREPDKVPIAIGASYWPFGYAKVNYKDILDDPAATAAAHTKYLDDIEVDWTMLGTLAPLRTNEALGSNEYTMSADNSTVQHNQTGLDFMPTEEYDDLIKDYPGYLAGKALKRRFPKLCGTRKEAYEALKKAAIAHRTFMKANELIGKRFLEKGVRSILAFGPDVAPHWYSPINVLFTRLRGMKETLKDMRKRPDTIKAATAAIRAVVKPSTLNPDVYLTRSLHPLSWTIYHSECFLSPEQFDTFFFKGFKETALPFMEKGARYFLKGEGAFLNTIDRYKELPRGAMVILLDQDDPFEAYKHIGGYHTLAAGPNLDLLRAGTKQQCIDYVKKCFDTFAPGGGYIFVPPKSLVAPSDVKDENVVAVYQFANEYAKKK
jgi:hypothetical protein